MWLVRRQFRQWKSHEYNVLQTDLKYPAAGAHVGFPYGRTGTRTAVPPSFDAAAWHVQYRIGGRDHLLTQPTPELAIESACRLIDDGADVYGIGTGPLRDSIAREQIARIYSLWARERLPFGRNAA